MKQITREEAAALLEGVTPGEWRVTPEGVISGQYPVSFEADGALLAASKPLAHTVVALHDRIAKMEAESRTLRAVVMATAEACDRADLASYAQEGSAFRDAFSPALSEIAPEYGLTRSWFTFRDALRALAGGAS